MNKLLLQYTYDLTNCLDYDCHIYIDKVYYTREKYVEFWIKNNLSSGIYSEEEITQFTSMLTGNISKNVGASKALSFHVKFIQPIFKHFKELK